MNAIKFDDETIIKYLSARKSYKILGAHINIMLDCRDHLKYVTVDVRQLAKVLTKIKLSSNRN